MLMATFQVSCNMIRLSVCFLSEENKFKQKQSITDLTIHQCSLVKMQLPPFKQG